MIIHTLRCMNQLVIGMLSKPSLDSLTSPIVTPFRCWPIDMDYYFHMNNSSYLKVAEFARWRINGATGQASLLARKNWRFLVVENKIQYLKSIAPFQRYAVETSLFANDNKYMTYRHVFRHLTKPEVIFATLEAKFVMKEMSGKTVHVDQLVQANEWFRSQNLGTPPSSSE